MGSSDSASREAAAEEARRRAEVAAVQQRIEGIYTSPQREADIEGVVGATRQYLDRDLRSKNSEAERLLRFALARSGQTMGSVDVDQRRDLGEAFLRGALEVERRAQQAGTTLRQADQSSKLNLFTMAQSGLDMTTAARQSSEAMRSNIASAQSEAMQSGLGDLFTQFADIHKRSRERAGERAAQRYSYQPFYAPSGAGGGW